MNSKYWCKCCNGIGTVAEVYYQFDLQSVIQHPSNFTEEKMKIIYISNNRNCPGCDGSKVSVRAQIERDNNPEFILPTN